MRISDWSSDVCSSDLDRSCVAGSTPLDRNHLCSSNLRCAFPGEQCPVWFQYLVSVLAAHFGLPRGIADQRGGGLPQYDADCYGQPAPAECFGASDQCCAASKDRKSVV